MATTSIVDLPLDVLVLIFPYLDAKSFLAFCATCKAFQQDSIRLDSSYWSHETRKTFRVPNQPIVQHDGDRWQKLYRRMLTQTRVFTWGSNSQNRLGHSSPELRFPGPRGVRRPRMAPLMQGCATPVEMDRNEELGIIADMQCGGWSTTLLTSKGTLHIAGILNGERQYYSRPHSGTKSLRFPVGYPYTAAVAAYEEPTIAIKQFSAGRSHILGLSDSGRIWSWYDVEKPSLHVKFVHVDLTEASSGESSPAASPLYGRVKQVVAGWSCSSAYVYGTGIVLWSPVQREPIENDETDTMLVMESFEVPQTAYQRVKGASRETDADKILSEEVGVVLNYIVLENYIVFVTDIGRVFCAHIGEGNRVNEILELQALRSKSEKPLDVQGTFRRFAIFKDGEVITTSQSYLDNCWNARQNNSDQAEIGGLQRIPALQNNDVISIAFGDYHFLALHSTGKITSYGTELQSCGALGLGHTGAPGTLRGVQYSRAEGKLIPHAYTNGRQVWFEDAKQEWLQSIAAAGHDHEEAKERSQLLTTDVEVQAEVSEWIEQEAKHIFTPVSKAGEDDGLGAFFALNVCAAGWHSGALVLHNFKVEKKDWPNQGFPRLRLRDGREMPGTRDFDEWRVGPPEWQLDVEV
ncbi:RCC1/BLIP-II [Aaosphaeria arxii CBS 175.79]|uniref:RCC1/BLIP-II n=1 Tax=Aaosphaeria arxii CBS 175.79 TaxID=1450172 RepID=A0A6A5XE94_9PLEO|nr:RCC1/BLIP-II [Aaosphaeria arxii CBS 175.79]KAF2011368.1 RCC1/BLIP-II [Aaosphaeria arxii CBS 175.79]